MFESIQATRTQITRVLISFLTWEERVYLLEVVLSISERKGVSLPLYISAVLKRDFQDVHPKNLLPLQY